jgi:hypothetical protein
MPEQLLQPKESVKHLPRQRLDIALSVCISDAQSVCDAVREIFLTRFPGQEAEFAILERVFSDIDHLYAGTYPKYYGCDTDYHDMRHILDVTLAAARLYDGYEKIHGGSDKALGIERIQLGIICALFHDIGYIRHRNDSKHAHGAEYTKIHVTRGTEFLARYLPSIGRADWVPRAKKLLHYTGYEKSVHMKDVLDHQLGCLLGTADLIAQMSDRAYLERCRDFLYTEFKIGNVAPTSSNGNQGFESPIALLDQTPDFIRNTIAKRLDGLFGSVYHYAAEHFGGPNLYMEGIEKNCRFLEGLLEERKLHLLNRQTR